MSRNKDRTYTNIVTLLRKEAGLTQIELAREAGVTPLTIMRTEQGLFNNVGLGIILALSEITKTHKNIAAIYAFERAAKIEEFGKTIRANPFHRSRVDNAIQAAFDDESDPFTDFRTTLFDAYDLPLSRIQFCCYTGLHLATVERLETGQSGLTPVVREMLAEVLGLTLEDIHRLSKAVGNSYVVS